jgi:hypothetical protein
MFSTSVSKFEIYVILGINKIYYEQSRSELE